jgi:hypothetical protein
LLYIASRLQGSQQPEYVVLVDIQPSAEIRDAKLGAVDEKLFQDIEGILDCLNAILGFFFFHVPVPAK